MIRALVAINGDGHVLHKSILGLPASVMEYDGVQGMVTDSLIMATSDVVKRKLPAALAMASRKSLIADNVRALSGMAANIVDRDGVGNITVLANEDILLEMDYIGTAYELDVIYPIGSEIPSGLTDGRKKIDEIFCEKYMIERYAQSVETASDTQIADSIAGMEEYFNMVDNMDRRDKDAVNRIARNIKMLNEAIRREDQHIDYDSYDDGHDSDTYTQGDMVPVEEVADEIARIWDTLQLASEQMSDMSDLIIDSQSTVADVLQYMKNNVPVPQILNQLKLLNGEISDVRHQVGLHIEESMKPVKQKIHPITWIVLGISLLAVLLSLINLLL